MSPLPDPTTEEGAAELNARLDAAHRASLEVIAAAQGQDLVCIVYRPMAVSQEGEVHWAIDTTAADPMTLATVALEIAGAVAGGATMVRSTTDPLVPDDVMEDLTRRFGTPTTDPREEDKS